MVINVERKEFESREKVLEYIKAHKARILDMGNQGHCTLLDNGRVAKYLYQDYTDYVLGFKNIKTKSYIFPDDGFYVDNYVVTLLMDYVNGLVLNNNKPLDQNLNTLGSQLKALAYDTLRIGEQGVLVKDFHCKNVIYDGNQFKVIDTLPYLLLPGGVFITDNLREVMNRIFEFLLEGIIKYRLVWEKHDYRGNIDCLRYPDKYLQELKTYLENTLGVPINTLGEAEIALKRTVK